MGREEFEAAFLERTRTLREKTNISQRQMAELLGCGQEAYRKYEARSPLPHHLLIKFCLITKTDVYYMYQGHRRLSTVGKGAQQAEVRQLRRQDDDRSATTTIG